MRALPLIPLILAGVAEPSAWAVTASSANCAPLKTPAEYCANFKTTVPLERDPNVQSVKKVCEAFYAEAIQSVAIVCDYKAKAAAVNNAGSAISTAVVTQNGSVGSTAVVAGDQRPVYQDFMIRSNDQLKKFKKLHDSYEGALTKLGVYGADTLKLELRCDQMGQAGAAEGAQSIGLAKYSLEWERETYRAVGAMLGMFVDQMWVNAADTQNYTGNLKRLDDRFAGSLTAGKAGADQLVNRAVPTVPGFDPSSTAEATGADKASEFAVTSTRSLLSTEAAVAGGVAAQQELGKRASSFLGTMIKEAIPAATLAGGAKLIMAEKKDGLTITNVGIGMVISLTGVSLGPAIGLGIALDVIETGIRRTWALRDLGIIKPYLDSLAHYEMADSQAAARQYMERKATQDYCKKCNHVDTTGMNYCPAHNEYNPNWYDDNDHAGRPQRWNTPDPTRYVPPGSN